MSSCSFKNLFCGRAESRKRKAESGKQKAKSYCSGWIVADFVQHRIKMITLITMILFFWFQKMNRCRHFTCRWSCLLKESKEKKGNQCNHFNPVLDKIRFNPSATIAFCFLLSALSLLSKFPNPFAFSKNALYWCCLIIFNVAKTIFQEQMHEILLRICRA